MTLPLPTTHTPPPPPPSLEPSSSAHRETPLPPLSPALPVFPVVARSPCEPLPRALSSFSFVLRVLYYHLLFFRSMSSSSVFLVSQLSPRATFPSLRLPSYYLQKRRRRLEKLSAVDASPTASVIGRSISLPSRCSSTLFHLHLHLLREVRRKRIVSRPLG